MSEKGEPIFLREAVKGFLVGQVLVVVSGVFKGVIQLLFNKINNFYEI